MSGKKTKNKDNKQSSWKIVKDEKFRITVGLLTIFFAALLTLAFVSYFFTWKSDQSFEWGQVVSGSSVQVENWSGKIGAKLAFIFITKGIGISALGIPFVLFILGFRLMSIRLLPLRKYFRITLIAAILFSLILGFILGNTGGYLGSGLGGSHGFFVVQWLNSVLGKTGTAFLLLLSTLTFVFFTFPKSAPWFKAKVASAVSNKTFVAPATPFKVEDQATEKWNESEKSPFIEDIDDKEDEDLDTNFRVVPTIPEEKIVDDDVELTIEQPVIREEAVPEIGRPVEQEVVVMGNYDPTLDLSHYKLPPLELLEDHKSNNSEVSNEELISNKNKIVETLANYKIQIDKIKATIGPTVTLYEIVPAPGVRISKIKSLEDDIALSLSALGIRIIAPMPGKGTIGIEVPNLKPEIVSMRSIISSRKFQESNFELAIALGKTISNETYVFDLTKMPHLLVAGATGQGKSVGLNAIITSILYRKHPSQVKFVLVDPKKVELTLYSKLERHFLAKLPDTEEAIITDTQKVINTLNSLTIEMDNRYELLKHAQVRNIKEYNERFIARKLSPLHGHRFLPYIVVVIDEFADLIMTAGREVETPIARLAQLARAIGIHLIIATQRPTTNIITGVIKANFPARIAFRVTSMIDSRTILDSPGANQLIGRGDLLFAPGSDMVRIQCAFIDIPEIEHITDYIGSQQGYPEAMPLPEYKGEDPKSDVGDVDLNKRDDLFDDAARLVVMHQQGSTSLIQRKFSIGYNRAGRIMDQLEKAGIVGPFEGSKARQVMYVDEVSLEQFLSNMSKN
ncbi:MAG: DNA translocase FtsK 4TM domain-containing protein [Bacteroidota bacterium]|nr:DNA translocase FtsK 4TM domain-containing protein [Bacteroidota bacterium]